MTGGMRILILGGYGVFGGRLARLLADEARLTLVIAGRSAEKARAFCAGLGGAAMAEAAVFDRTAPVEIAGEVNLLSAEAYTDLTLAFHGDDTCRCPCGATDDWSHNRPAIECLHRRSLTQQPDLRPTIEHHQLFRQPGAHSVDHDRCPAIG